MFDTAYIARILENDKFLKQENGITDRHPGNAGAVK
jgi:hypothetical protein